MLNDHEMAHCPGCKQPAQKDAKFCSSCGAALRSSPFQVTSDRSGESLPPIGPSADGERRYLSVLFCDLVDSTALASSLDPEDYGDLLVRFHAAASKVIEAAGGYVAQHLGDGLLVYFGFPQASEHDAERACHCGLNLIEQLSELDPIFERWSGRPLRLRVGIHTGLLVINRVGEGGRAEVLALGGTANIAARIQSAAEPGCLLVSDAVYQRVRRSFTTKPLGSHELKGLSEEMRLHQVIQVRGLDSNFVGDETELTPLLGRDAELAQLNAAFEQAREGHAQVVMIQGEAGMGKSRLAYALRQQLAETQHVWLPCRGAQYHHTSPLYPFVQLQRELMGLARRATASERFTWLKRSVSEAGLDLPSSLPVLALLHELPLDDGYTAPALTPLGLRKRTFEVLIEWLLSLAQKQTVVLSVEDVHFLDPSSIDLLSLLISQLGQARLLVVLTNRTSFEPAWLQRDAAVNIELSRLDDATMTQIVVQSRPDLELSNEAITLAVSRAGGVPLFGEALAGNLSLQIRSGVEQSYVLPETLEESLLARLDHGELVKDLAQLASVIGFQFSLPEIMPLWERTPEEFTDALDRAQAQGILFRVRHGEGTVYGFRHALFRDAAYHSLVRKTRHRYHGLVASTLTLQFPEIAEKQPELLAHHFKEAGQVPEAIAAYGKASHRSLMRGSLKESIEQLQLALTLLAGAEPKTELDLQQGLARALVLDRGWAHPDTKAAWERAAELCDADSSPLRRGAIDCGLGDVYSSLDLATSLQHFTNLTEFGRKHDQPLHIIAGHQGAGLVLYYMGRFSEAREHLDRGIELYDPEQHRFFDAGFHEEKGVNLFCWSAWIYGIMGKPDSGRQHANRAIELAEHFQNPFALAFAICWAACLELYARNWDEALRLSKEAARVATTQGFVAVEALSLMAEAIAEGIRDGHADAASRFLQQLSRFGDTGNRLGGPNLMALMADLSMIQNDPAASRHFAEMGLGLAQATGQPCFDAWLLTLRARALEQTGTGRSTERGQSQLEAESDVDDLLEQAATLARQQKAHCFELTVALERARRLAARHQRDAAENTLREAISTFTEGSSGALNEARAALSILQHSASVEEHA